MPALTAFNSLSVNGNGQMRLVLPYGNEGSYDADVVLRERRDLPPKRDDITYRSRELPFKLTQGSWAGSTEAWVLEVQRVFRPSAGLRTLSAMIDGGTVTLQVDVTHLERTEETMYEGVFLAANPVWESTTTTSSSTSPLTVGGNIEALPTIRFEHLTADIVSSSVANPSVLTFSGPHGFVSGDIVGITGHGGSTPSINNVYAVTYVDATHVSIPVNVTVGGVFGSAGKVIRRARVTITDQTGHGLQNYPVRIGGGGDGDTFDTTGVGATDKEHYICFAAGLAVPFVIQDPNHATDTVIDLAVNVPPGGETLVDIFYGKYVNNTVTADDLASSAIKFALGGLDLDHADYAGDSVVWNDFRVSWFPDRTLSWRPAKFGPTQQNVSFGITAEGASASKDGGVSASTIRLSLRPGNGVLLNDANAIVLSVGSDAEATDALKGLSRNLVINAGVMRARVYYRVRGSRVWQVAWTGASTATTTADVSVPGAVQILVALEPTDQAADADLTIGISGTFRLLLATNPTVEVAAPVLARVHNSSLINTTTGDVLTLTDVYMDNVSLIIDTKERSIRSADGSVVYGRILPTNEAQYFPLPVGSVGFTAPDDARVSFLYAARVVA